MKKGTKILVNAAFFFGVIAFIAYLFLLISGYVGCCVGLNEILFDKVSVVVVVSAAVVLVFCILNNCIKISKERPDG